MKTLAPLAAVVFLAAVVQIGSVRKDQVSELTDLNEHKYIANAGEQSKIKKSEQMKIKFQKTRVSNDCRAKRKCTKKNGECKAECNVGERKIRKGCKGKGCKCCVLKKVCKKKAKKCKRKHGGVCLPGKDDCLENKFVVKGKCGKKCGLCCAKDDEDSSSSVKCGIEGPSSWRIINGVNVTEALKYSWQVGMSKEDKPDIDYHCGGSIITEKHILIAAHCFYTLEGKLQIPDELFIGIGSNDMKNPKLVITKEEVFIHEGYVYPIDNDIAIIELSKSVELLKNKIHPICLPKDDSKDYTGEIGTVTGWGGMTGHNPEPFPNPEQEYQNILQEAHTPILSDDECFKQNYRYIKEKMICASSKEGFEDGGQGICFGDSGGPFSVKYNNQHEQIGIVSWSVGCVSKGNPDYYARVTTYLDWIKEKVGSEKTYTIA